MLEEINGLFIVLQEILVISKISAGEVSMVRQWGETRHKCEKPRGAWKFLEGLPFPLRMMTSCLWEMAAGYCGKRAELALA